MPADSVSVTVTITPGQEGYVNEQFFLKTDSENQSLVPMRVTYTGVKADRVQTGNPSVKP